MGWGTMGRGNNGTGAYTDGPVPRRLALQGVQASNGTWEQWNGAIQGRPRTQEAAHHGGYRLAMGQGTMGQGCNGTRAYRAGPVPKKLHIAGGTGWQWGGGKMDQGCHVTRAYMESPVPTRLALQGVQAMEELCQGKNQGD